MQVMAFNTDVVPQERRLAAFQRGAVEFDVEALSDPLTFAARWRMLKLGDVNLIHCHVPPLRYRRDAARIAADGIDRFTLHYCLVGGEHGTINGLPVRVGAGEGIVWDLTLPLDLRSEEYNETLIITLPRHLLHEVLPGASIAGALGVSPELNLAVEQARYLLDHAESLPEDAGVVLGRALREMLAVAMLPAYRTGLPAGQPDAPLLRRMIELIDSRLAVDLSLEEVASALRVRTRDVAAVAEHFGGVSLLVERRRLLGAYRLLCNPRETDTVEAIAKRCGFRSLPQFSRRFHSAFHTSARDLRRLGRGRLPAWAGAYHVERLYNHLITS